jgi:hypothetical protein
LWRGCEEGHDCQAPFLVNDTVELEERFRIHGVALRRSVK